MIVACSSARDWTGLPQRNGRGELGYHDDRFLLDLEQRMKLRRSLRTKGGQKRDDEARIEAA